jgi:hypothetical protein
MNKVAIHGVPRSGTTWLANIFNSHERVAYRQQPLFSYAFKGFLDEHSSEERIREFFDQIYLSDDTYLNQVKEIEDGKVPKFSKLDATHVVYKEVRYHYILDNLLERSDVHLIALIRNPLATLSSFFKAPAEFKDSWTQEDEWLDAPKKNQGLKESYFGYNKWKEVTTLFLELEQKFGKERVSTVRYSELLADPLKTTETLFAATGLESCDQTMDFIKQSKSFEHPNAYSVFRTKEADIQWKTAVDQQIIEAVNRDLKGTHLEKFL